MFWFPKQANHWLLSSAGYIFWFCVFALQTFVKHLVLLFLACRYLMDPNMDFVKFFGKNYDAKALAEGVSEEIRNANKQKEVSLSQHA